MPTQPFPKIWSELPLSYPPIPPMSQEIFYVHGKDRLQKTHISRIVNKLANRKRMLGRDIIEFL
jgi:hypothetical protein